MTRTIRLATYNVEWFSGLFDDQDALIDDDSWSARHNTTKAQQTRALGAVFQALDADAVMVIEAPDSNSTRSGTKALEHFAQRFGLRARSALMGFANHTSQEIALLYDPDTLCARHDPQASDDAPLFDQEFKIDLDIDAQDDPVQFSKPPLEIDLHTAWGSKLRLIGAHLKSKAPHGAKTKEAAIRISIANRRKQLAQCIWLRKRIEAHLSAKDALIVMGDFNDGPGLDEYEALFGRSSVEIVLGVEKDPKHRMTDPHAAQALSQRMGAQMTTSRFYLPKENRYLNALLDYVMVSPDLLARGPKWHIWHPFDDPLCWEDAQLSQALLAASDHFPVSLDISV